MSDKYKNQQRKIPEYIERRGIFECLLNPDAQNFLQQIKVDTKHSDNNNKSNKKD